MAASSARRYFAGMCDRAMPTVVPLREVQECCAAMEGLTKEVTLCCLFVTARCACGRAALSSCNAAQSGEPTPCLRDAGRSRLAIPFRTKAKAKAALLAQRRL